MKFDRYNASIIVVVAGQAGQSLTGNPELAIPPVSPGKTPLGCEG